MSLIFGKAFIIINNQPINLNFKCLFITINSVILVSINSMFMSIGKGVVK